MTSLSSSLDTRPFLTEAETARLLCVHPSTLARLARSGEAPVTPVLVGQRRVYPRRSVEALAGVTE